MEQQLIASDRIVLQALGAGSKHAVCDHLVRLSPEDRSLRFWGACVTDESIRKYVDGIRFGGDIVLAMVDDEGRVRGLAHGCVYEARGVPTVEAAFSVDEDLRGQGWGNELMECLVDAAGAIGVRSIVAMCVARNQPMRRVFARAGMEVSREEDEVHAVLANLAPAKAPAHEAVESATAELLAA
jgi:RimJ/RimL family protein N-acetyltransferase